jgi:hypothetical protein
MPLDINGTYVSPRWVRVAETAKLVRADLKREFPGVKFSVRSDSYSGGASIRVRWTDGPTAPAVDRVVKRYEGSRFDGMTDLKYGVSNWLCPVHGPRTAEVYGNSWDSESVGVELKAKYGIDYDVTSYRNTYDADRLFHQLASATGR